MVALLRGPPETRLLSLPADCKMESLVVAARRTYGHTQGPRSVSKTTGDRRMLRLKTELLVAFLGPMLLVAACSSSSGRDRTAQELGYRLQTQLVPDIAAGQAVLERLPDGTRVTLSEQALFPGGKAELDDKGRYVLASVIEGLVDPRLLRIEVEASPATPVSLQAAHVRAVTQYFKDYQLGPALQESTIPQGMPSEAMGAAAPQGLTITVTII
jgi:hypothetical protein